MIEFNKQIMVIIKSVMCLRYKINITKYAIIIFWRPLKNSKKIYYKLLIIIFFLCHQILNIYISNILLNKGRWEIRRHFLMVFGSMFGIFGIGEIMVVLMKGKTWPEFSEFEIISKKIG